MCGRFNIIDNPLNQFLNEITGQHQDWKIKTEYNVAPTESVPVLLYDEVAESWNLRRMRWWLTPSWSRGPDTRYSMFNAKSETLSNSRAYKELFKKRRCIIPASGYYEWKSEHTQKLPYYVTPVEEFGFAFAGLWDCWQSENQTIESCTIVTTAAPQPLKKIHHRMPVNLTNKHFLAWMSDKTSIAELKVILRPATSTNVRVTPVSTLANNASIKDNRCIEPVGESFNIK